MHERVVERLELRSELQRAIELDQLEIYYQPVVRLAAGTDYGVEALLRWNHPERGVIAPASFIPLAEETGLIVPIGQWVLREACKKGVELQRRFPQPQPLTISVNLSVKQLQSETIVSDVREALESTRFAGVARARDHRDRHARGRRHRHRTAARSEGARSADRNGRLRNGLLVAQLPEPPAGRHPQDGQIVPERRHERHGLASAIMAIGDQFGLEVVAEGIEHQSQNDSLQSLGFGLGQGFLFGKPMHDGDLATYLGLAGVENAHELAFDPDAAA